MRCNRREFVILGCAAAAGCTGSAGENAPIRFRQVSIDAGPATEYAGDGVYDRFRDRGFFVIRRGTSLQVLSAICTHRACKLRAEPDRTFYCKCHGSTFDPGGHVTEGPARRNLPILPSSVEPDGHLWVHALAVTAS